MILVEDTIREFGRGMGIGNLSLNDQGLLGLAFESTGSLFLERADDFMLIYLAKDIPPYETGILEKALKLCHYHQGLPLSVNTALSKQNQLVFLIRASETDFTLPFLEKAVRLLIQLHQKVKEERFF